MHCSEVSERISEHFDGEAPAAVAVQIQAHIANCERCASELRAYLTIRRMLKSAELRDYSAPVWEQFAERLEIHQQLLTSGGVAGPHRKLAGFTTLAVAASMLVAVGLMWQSGGNSDRHNHNRAHKHNSALETVASVAIDFEELLAGGAAQPAAALNRLTQKFDGQEAAATASASLLGFRPSITQALPAGVKLVSNRVLALPVCNCAAGTCTCGPGGCNCAASLCKRADGTDFLVVEHCETQPVTFGSLRSEWVNKAASKFQLLSKGEQFTATWIANHRRLTAIGLTDRAEAESLVGGLAAH